MAKAEAAELKAETAKDAGSYERNWRDAGRLWERAADRESDMKRRAIYTAKAERARTAADEPMPASDEPMAVGADEAAPDADAGMN